MLNKNQRIPSKSATKNGRTIHFYEDTHEYIDTEGNKYTSVTGLKKRFFPEFDEKAKAEEMAKREGISTKEYLDYWEKLRTIASEHGTNVHYACEKYIKDKEIITFEKEKTNNCAKSAIQLIKHFPQNIISTEKLIFSPEIKIAGQIDIIARKGKCLFLYDWKTNKEISKESFDNEMGYKPFEDFPNSNYWHYVFQLNTYLYLLLREKYYPWAEHYALHLLHIRDGQGVLGYELPLIQDRLKKIFD